MVTPHPLDYVEISVTSMSAAKAFYFSALGWEFNDYGEEYAGIRAPGAALNADEVGGLTTVGSAPGPGGIMALARSADLDASLAAAEAAGAVVLEAPYDYPGGRRFVCADLDGNRIGVYQPAQQ